jgi:hypothetical protein
MLVVRHSFSMLVGTTRTPEPATRMPCPGVSPMGDFVIGTAMARKL